jgi:hypothetical protein
MGLGQVAAQEPVQNIARSENMEIVDGMKSPDAVYVIGLRLSPDVDAPELYTIWFEYDSGDSKVATRAGRLQWTFTVSQVSRIADDEYDLVTDDHARSDYHAVCDVANLLYSIQSGADDSNVKVLDSINLLDDLLIAIDNPLPADGEKLLARMVVGLTEGGSLSSVVPPENRAGTIEAIFASLGRVLAFSDFVGIGRG